MHKGNHIFIDYENFTHELGRDYQAHRIFRIMSDAINNLTNMKIVHSHLEILKEPETQDGFTSVLLLDESHFTAHAYTGKHNLLALDLFTCGGTDTKFIMNEVNRTILKEFPNIKLNSFVVNKRFKYNH